MIIYSAISWDKDITRFSATPTLDSENEGEGGRLPGRVAFSRRPLAGCGCDDCLNGGSYMESCRVNQARAGLVVSDIVAFLSGGAA